MNSYLKNKVILFKEKLNLSDNANFQLTSLICDIIFEVAKAQKKNPNLNFKGEDCEDENTLKVEEQTPQEMFANAKLNNPMFCETKHYTIEELQEIFKGTGNKFSKMLEDWKAPDYNLSEMFCGDENKTLNKW